MKRAVQSERMPMQGVSTVWQTFNLLLQRNETRETRTESKLALISMARLMMEGAMQVTPKGRASASHSI
jgi:hypothetical protein